MPSRTWTTTLDDRPLELRAEHRLPANELVVWVDGFPAHREKLPDTLWPQAKVLATVGALRMLEEKLA